MKKHLLFTFLAFIFLAVGNLSAQDKDKDSKEDGYLCEGHYKGDYHCWRAWKKERKIHKKMAMAEDMACYRPWAAERKMRAAYRKAWKRDNWETDHRHGNGHGWWGWGWRGRDYWY